MAHGKSKVIRRYRRSDFPGMTPSLASVPIRSLGKSKFRSPGSRITGYQSLVVPGGGYGRGWTALRWAGRTSKAYALKRIKDPYKYAQRALIGTGLLYAGGYAVSKGEFTPLYLIPGYGKYLAWKRGRAFGKRVIDDPLATGGFSPYIPPTIPWTPRPTGEPIPPPYVPPKFPKAPGEVPPDVKEEARDIFQPPGQPPTSPIVNVNIPGSNMMRNLAAALGITIAALLVYLGIKKRKKKHVHKKHKHKKKKKKTKRVKKRARDKKGRFK